MRQVYAARFPDGGGQVQISTDGGTEPLWAANGRELFYRNGDKMMSASIAAEPVFTTGKPQVLFSGAPVAGRSFHPAYAVSHDGRHFYMVKVIEAEPVRQIDVIVNWFEELKRRVPSGK